MIFSPAYNLYNTTSFELYRDEVILLFPTRSIVALLCSTSPISTATTASAAEVHIKAFKANGSDHDQWILLVQVSEKKNSLSLRQKNITTVKKQQQRIVFFLAFSAHRVLPRRKAAGCRAP